MREIITIHVGQAGNNIGSTFWEHMRGEHDIDSDGQQSKQTEYGLSRSDVYFNQFENGRFAARAIFTDLDSNSVNSVRASANSRLYNPNNFISSNNGARNNWAIGHYTRGRELINQIMETVKKEGEQCDSLQAFQIFHSISGGSGSGMGSFLIKKIKEQYPDQIIQSYSIFPDQGIQDIVVSPYNATLSVWHLIEYPTLSIVMDNKAINNLCFRKYNVNPNYQDLNNIISQAICGLTASQRFSGPLNCDQRQLAVNLVPYPRQHFCSMATAPINYQDNQEKEQVTDIIDELFESKSQTCTINFNNGKFMCNQFNFRGCVATSEVEEGLCQFKKKHQASFYEWNPNINGISICNVPNKCNKISATALFTTTAITSTFTHLAQKFNALFKRKAHLHWYLAEGMDEIEFSEASENMADLIAEYQQYDYASEPEGYYAWEEVDEYSN